eukprot:COSAG02_NODE_1196_length_13929_cov_17.931039_5_plen_82_part_00
MLEMEEEVVELAVVDRLEDQLRQPLRVARTRLGRRDEVLLHKLSVISNLNHLGSLWIFSPIRTNMLASLALERPVHRARTA